ncbi:MAG: hypothetical protein HY594_05640, partial [Candidatus Omnitrophica bacterium]|nr:hypothetical protein [Candidatus Omnitrophota bacterium]
MSSSRILILRQWALALSDMIGVAGAFWAAYGLRFHFQIVPLKHPIPPQDWYVRPLGLILFIYLLSFRAVGLYAIRHVQL